MAGKQKYNEVPGNAVQSTLNYQRMMLGIAEAIMLLGRTHETCDPAVGHLKGFSIKAAPLTGGDWFITLRAHVEGEDVVGFHAGDTLEEALKGACNRYVYGHIKWRRDEFANK